MVVGPQKSDAGTKKNDRHFEVDSTLARLYNDGMMKPAHEQLSAFIDDNMIATGKLARQLGVTRGYLWSIRTGRTAPGRKLARRLADLCNIPMRAWDDDELADD